MAHLTIEAGPLAGQTVELDGDVSFGRRDDNTVCLRDVAVSRYHASIVKQAGQFHLLDRQSGNGTWLNGRRVPAEGRALRDRDSIEIGTSAIRFCADKQPEKSPVPSPPTTDERNILSVSFTPDSCVQPSIDATLDATLAPSLLIEGHGADAARLEQVVRHLETMIAAAKDLATATEHSVLLPRILDHVLTALPHASRALLLQPDAETGEMVLAAGRSRGEHAVAEDDLPISRTVVNRVVERRESILSSDAQADFEGQQSIQNLAIRSVMCVPLLWHDDLLGILNVDTTATVRPFTAADLGLLTGIAAQAAAAIRNAELHATAQTELRKRTVLSRYMSPDVVQGVLDERIPCDFSGCKAHGTVLFCDIVGFTKMADAAPTLDVVRNLNRFFSRSTEVITHHGGTIHKFQGDMVMAFWNVMFPVADHAYRAALASLDLQAEVWELNRVLMGEGQQPIHVGIGCNSGDFFAGNIGGEDRFEYTIIGDTVNLASRIEGLAGSWQVLVSEQTREAVGEASVAIALPPARVKGKDASIRTYSLRGLRHRASAWMTAVLPAQIAAAGGAPVCALITGVEPRLEGGLRLRLLLQPPPAEGRAVQVRLELPELRTPVAMNGVVAAMATETELPPGVRFDCTIDVESAAAAALLRPGAATASDRSWEEMVRR